MWSEYYSEFPYFSEELIRDGCHPRKMVHEVAAEKAIVLVHGLSDSPYFLSAVGDFFHFELSYDVYLPLLYGHGLKDPDGARGASLEEWKKNVRFAIHTAAGSGRFLSVGGLSTGGTLSLYMGCNDPLVTGDVYLFAAALGLKEGWLGIAGSVKEFLLRLPLILPANNRAPLIGSNPYRYDYVSLNGARELIHLIVELGGVIESAISGGHFPQHIFSVSTEYDDVVSLKAIDKLREVAEPGNFSQYIIPENLQVEHASIVLEDPIFAIDAEAGDSPLEKANPEFFEMMEAIKEFEQ
ncbi:MAG: hypothetical protein JRJ68_13300 [Deltaproteobacteria bacterium]|nr:hypothetical protein [Deltaproteobacteria bacterium]